MDKNDAKDVFNGESSEEVRASDKKTIRIFVIVLALFAAAWLYIAVSVLVFVHKQEKARQYELLESVASASLQYANDIYDQTGVFPRDIVLNDLIDSGYYHETQLNGETVVIKLKAAEDGRPMLESVSCGEMIFPRS